MATIFNDVGAAQLSEDLTNFGNLKTKEKDLMDIGYAPMSAMTTKMATSGPATAIMLAGYLRERLILV